MYIYIYIYIINLSIMRKSISSSARKELRKSSERAAKEWLGRVDVPHRGFGASAEGT